jgi:hypothetical protein
MQSPDGVCHGYIEKSCRVNLDNMVYLYSSIQLEKVWEMNPAMMGDFLNHSSTVENLIGKNKKNRLHIFAFRKSLFVSIRILKYCRTKTVHWVSNKRLEALAEEVQSSWL